MVWMESVEETVECFLCLRNGRIKGQKYTVIVGKDTGEGEKQNEQELQDESQEEEMKLNADDVRRDVNQILSQARFEKGRHENGTNK